MEYEINLEEPVSLAVVRAVSAVTGLDSCSIRPLAEILDPDALDALFAQRDNGKRRSGGELSFIYADCRVTIQNGEYITVRTVATDADIV